MLNEDDVKVWFRYADMDYDTAVHLLKNMYPMPSEIICYHSQQAAEKYLKGILISFGEEIIKTHDLVFLANEIQNHSLVSADILKICAKLSVYGVKARYPKELAVTENAVKDAVENADRIKDWAYNTIGLSKK